MDKNIIHILCAIVLSLPAVLSADGLSKPLRGLAGRDTVCNVWVRFDAPAPRGGGSLLSDRAKARRKAAGFTRSDRAVSRAYINDIVRMGGRLRHEFPWDNAASFSVHASILNDVAALPHVVSVTPVAVYVRGAEDADARGLRKPSAPRSSADGYGRHGEMVGLRFAHDYIRAKGMGDPGSGVIAAFFDTGFRLSHKAFTGGRDAGDLVIVAYDFVENDETVDDPESEFDDHGTHCLGLVAGYDPGRYAGAAWGARFLAARTEDYDREMRIEEDNWAAAVVWAEGLGAQIISSSVGYRDGFDNADDDYDYEHLDGGYSVISRAAKGAVERGVIVVNSIGNEYNEKYGTLIAPADVDGVVSVGAVDGNRTLAWFSSTGPTADGRSKPEVVAPGVSVPLIDPYGYDTYTTGNGTSYAAPIVSGIMALILQAHPGIAPGAARERLYNSCTFARGQTEIGDNKHGYGIPNALRAVMNDDEIFVKATDDDGEPMPGALITLGTDQYVADGAGVAVMTARASDLPLELSIVYNGVTQKTVTVTSLPFVAGDPALGVKWENGVTVKSSGAVKRRITEVRGRYYFETIDAAQTASASIRMINGRMVWSGSLKISPDGVATIPWNSVTRGGGKTAPGVYIMTVKQGRHHVSRKIIAAN